MYPTIPNPRGKWSQILLDRDQAELYIGRLIADGRVMFVAIPEGENVRVWTPPDSTGYVWPLEKHMGIVPLD